MKNNEEGLSVHSSELALDVILPRDRTCSVFNHFERYYLENHASLCRFLIATGCRPETASDLVQDAFVRLFHQMRAGKPIERPRSWLIRVLHHLRLNHLRKHKREFALGDISEPEIERLLIDRSFDLELEMKRRQRAEWLASSIRQLTPVQFRCLMLRAEGLKFREIATLCGVSTATAAETCARALDKLRNLRHE